MSKNDIVIQEINEKSSEVLAEIEARDYQPFRVADVDLDGNDLSYKDILFNEQAKSAFLGLLRVKDDFPSLGQSIDRDRWKSAFKTIKETCDMPLYALYGVEDDGTVAIQSIYPKKPSQDNMIRHRSIFASICRSLGETEIEFKLSDFGFDRRYDTFNLTLQEPKSIATGIDDMWNSGSAFIFNEMNFQHLPYLERLKCQNGMMTTDYGFKSRVDQKKHSIVKVGSIITRAITEGNPEITKRIDHAIHTLKATNASVLEFEKARKAIKESIGDNEELFQRIDAQYFDDAHIMRSYGVVLNDQTAKWKGGADSGVNAFGLFNLMTWIASHQKITGVDKRATFGIQLAASKLFFKNPLDLRDIANPVNTVEQKAIPEMN